MPRSANVYTQSSLFREIFFLIMLKVYEMQSRSRKDGDDDGNARALAGPSKVPTHILARGGQTTCGAVAKCGFYGMLQGLQARPLGPAGHATHDSASGARARDARAPGTRRHDVSAASSAAAQESIHRGVSDEQG